MKLVFDIGFNVGNFAETCIQKYPDCKVVGVEANPYLPEWGRYNDFVQKYKNVMIISALACGTDNDERDFYVDNINIGISTASKNFLNNSRFSKGSKYVEPNTGKWQHIGKVQTITLDTLVNAYEKPDLIKVDVEGYEYEVFSGLSKKAGKICFECREEDMEEMYNVVSHLVSLGYENFGLIGIYDQGDIFDKLTYSEHGDPPLVEPDKYYPWNELKEEIEKCFVAERRINYGMMWVK
tara:strand:+ start:3313 stop:4026 length:714 start_codon:yes stop_codon:yes gene_type:complete